MKVFWSATSIAVKCIWQIITLPEFILYSVFIFSAYILLLIANIKQYIFFLLAALGPRCCARAFSGCGERGYSSLQCTAFSLLWLLLLRSTGSRHTGSVVVARGLSCSLACGIFLDQGLNPCPLHWQEDS